MWPASAAFGYHVDASLGRASDLALMHSRAAVLTLKYSEIKAHMCSCRYYSIAGGFCGK